MASPKCVAKIPTGRGLCTDAYCRENSIENDLHCLSAKPPLNPDDPIGPIKDPNLNGPGKGGYCYCCCSCFGGNTPVEVSPGEYKLVRDISTGESILTADTGLNWTPRAVESSSTWDSADALVSAMYFLRYRYGDAGGDTRDVMVSADHLFLVEDGTLVAIQDLTKVPLRLRRADGGLSDVVVVAQGTYRGGVTTIQMEGEFNGRDLAGHLLNTNGLVSADFKVQVHYSAQRLSPELIKEFGGREGLAVGTPEYHEEFPDDAYARFVNDPGQWPEGFTPTRFTQARVPAHASRYLTDEQAHDILRHAPKDGSGDTYSARALLYLFNLLRGLYPDTDFVLDWEDPLPNAYSWAQWGRHTVLVTGGLVRVKELGRDGLALILSAMISYQLPNVHCVGEADNAGMSWVLRNLWDGELFEIVAESALPRIEKLFSYISPEHAQPDPHDRCQAPGIACRIQSYQDGVSLFPPPRCATPKPDYFDVRDARAFSLTSVQVTFSRTLNVPTAESTDNYALEPASEVVSATVNPRQPSLVLLEVAELTPETTYLVRVSDVVSDDDVPLNPRRSTGAFMTK
jgi:hypothetical protein